MLCVVTIAFLNQIYLYRQLMWLLIFLAKIEISVFFTIFDLSHNFIAIGILTVTICNIANYIKLCNFFDNYNLCISRKLIDFDTFWEFTENQSINIS